MYQPIWGHVWDRTLVDASAGVADIRASDFAEPRIEPEIVLGLDGDVEADMSIEEIERRVGWVAHGLEIVQSHYAGWRFAVADCVADGGLHGALIVGPRRDVSVAGRSGLAARLSAVTLTLSRNGETVDRGVGANVLDGPSRRCLTWRGQLRASLRNAGIAAGEVVTTGTLTRAFPIAAGESWVTDLASEDDMSGLTLGSADDYASARKIRFRSPARPNSVCS